MTKGNTICPRPFHGGGIKIKVSDRKLQSSQNQRDEQAVSAVVGLKEWISPFAD
jgi:hypothetical protein